MPRVTELGHCRVKPGPCASQPFAVSGPLEWGGHFRLGRVWVSWGLPLGLAPQLLLSVLLLSFELYLVGTAGWLPRQPVSWRLHLLGAASSLEDTPRAWDRLAAAFPCRRAVTADKWPKSFSTSFSLLVRGLSCPDNPFHLVLSFWMPRRSPGSDSPAFTPTKRRHRQAAS